MLVCNTTGGCAIVPAVGAVEWRYGVCEKEAYVVEGSGGSAMVGQGVRNRAGMRIKDMCGGRRGLGGGEKGGKLIVFAKTI